MRLCPNWLCGILAIFGLHQPTPILGTHNRLRQALAQLHEELTRNRHD